VIEPTTIDLGPQSGVPWPLSHGYPFIKIINVTVISLFSRQITASWWSIIDNPGFVFVNNLKWCHFWHIWKSSKSGWHSKTATRRWWRIPSNPNKFPPTRWWVWSRWSLEPILKISRLWGLVLSHESNIRIAKKSPASHSEQWFCSSSNKNVFHQKSKLKSESPRFYYSFCSKEMAANYFVFQIPLTFRIRVFKSFQGQLLSAPWILQL